MAVTPCDTAVTGAILKKLAVPTVSDEKSRIHGLEDGATTWIAEQVECRFGAQDGYLIDFYHLCDYLAGAANLRVARANHRWDNYWNAKAA